MTTEQFFTKYNGRFLDFDGRFGYQCVDVMRSFTREVLGLDPYLTIPPTGAARRIYLSFKENDYFVKVPNTPLGMPKKGDLVFWGFYPGITTWAGHVGIYNEGDLFVFTTFSQNYPTGSPCHFQRHGRNKVLHGYRGVMGWLSPKR